MKIDSVLKWSALLAAMYLSYSAEYGLALECGFSPYTAPAFPVALDLFMIWSIRERRAVAASVLAVVAFNVSAHLPLSGRWLMAVTVAAAIAAPLIVWAMHVRPRVRASERPVDSETTNRPQVAFPAPLVAAESVSAPDPVAVADEFWSDFLATAPDADPLLSAAQEFDVDTRKRTGKGPTLRQMQARFKVGQQRAQRIRAQLAGSACAPV